MIDPRLARSLARSTLTHPCCFKCLLPWKQAAEIKVCHTDNGLCLHPCCCAHHLPNFPSFLPPHPSLHSVPSVPVPRLLPLFIHPHISTSFIHQVKPSATLFIIISTCRIIRFISLLSSVHVSTRMSLNPPISVLSCPHLFFSLALFLVWTQVYRNACRH